MLADGRVARQAIRVFMHGKLRRCACPYAQHGTPLGKARASGIVLGTALAKIVYALQCSTHNTRSQSHD